MSLKTSRDGVQILEAHRAADDWFKRVIDLTVRADKCEIRMRIEPETRPGLTKMANQLRALAGALIKRNMDNRPGLDTRPVPRARRARGRRPGQRDCSEN